MSKLVFDTAGTHTYYTGVDHVVLFVKKEDAEGYEKGVAWNGVTAITESPSGAEETAVYADNIKYLSLRSIEEFGATIEAMDSPDEFDVCDGLATLVDGITIGQQKRRKFCLAYRTKVGNDANDDAGYIIHIIYNATAAPTEKANNTVNESPEQMSMSWELSTTPVEVSGYKNTAHIEIDSTKLDADKYSKIEAALYGDENTEPGVLMPDEIVALVK
jgi:hypothetical protein